MTSPTTTCSRTGMPLTKLALFLETSSFAIKRSISLKYLFFIRPLHRVKRVELVR